MAQSLTDIGVNYLQGFYFSEPLPPAEFVERCGAQRGVSSLGLPYE